MTYCDYTLYVHDPKSIHRLALREDKKTQIQKQHTSMCVFHS